MLHVHHQRSYLLIYGRPLFTDLFTYLRTSPFSHGNRRLKNCHARDLISFVAAKGMGYKFNEIAGTLKIYPVKCIAYLTGVHPVTAGRCAEKGGKLLDSYEGM